MNKTVLNLFIILLFFSCKKNKATLKDKLEINSKTQTTKLIELESKEEELYIVKDSLTNVWTQEILEYSKHQNIIFSTNHRPIVNTHNKSVIDTISTYVFKESKIEIYRAKHRDILISAVLQNEDFILSDFIMIGLKVYVMEKSFATGIPDNYIKIGNSEYSTIFNFLFENGELKTIKYEGYLD
ncbi:MAG: hypothetical protein ABJK28_09505 [Algibacter sp.]